MRLLCAIWLTILVLFTSTARCAEPAAVAFGRDIQPLLSKRCFACHGPSGQPELVRFDRREAMVAADVIVPGKPDESELLKRITSTDPNERMPPKGDPLDASQIALLRQWIANGAAFEQHWAFRPMSDPPLPQAKTANWPRNSVDYFILAGLEKAGLSPAPEADRATLIRRLSFDLTGLPPTPQDVAAFAADESPQAYQRLVDHLLASPHFGERAAQHWLDVVRFAETEGFEYDKLLTGAWRYRDYVIDCFNNDIPFDKFVTEQLAGDELDPADARLQVAVGFHRLGPVRRNAGNPNVALSRNEVLTTRTDVIGAALLGLTIGCARCHDHKFDPVSQRDYYCLQAYLAGTEEHDIFLVSQAEQDEWKKQTDAITAEMKKQTESLKSAGDTEAREIQAKIEELGKSLPAPLNCITSIRGSEQPKPIHLLIRGEEAKKQDAVGPRVPGMFAGNQLELPLDVSKPRSKLAAWIVDPTNPLTTRVIVNRIWQQHFGRGLVATANDFGLHGEPPSHPELLDHLAQKFLAGGRSMKALHRLIVFSAAYRQGTREATGDRLQTTGRNSAKNNPQSDIPNSQSKSPQLIDPDNRLVWQHRPQRLDAEALRDAMLSVSGRLNLQRGGESVVVPLDEELTALLYKPSQWTVTPDVRQHDRRSIYLLAKRNLRLPFMETFDQPSAQSSCACREVSTHAPQSLELLNGRWSNDLAAAFAERLQKEAGNDHTAQISLAFRLTTSRAPTAVELQLSQEFLLEHSLREFALAMFNLNAFLYVD